MGIRTCDLEGFDFIPKVVRTMGRFGAECEHNLIRALEDHFSVWRRMEGMNGCRLEAGVPF